MYELTGLEVLKSQPYRERLDHPTAWTTRTMALFRNMVRSQCVVNGSEGGGIAHVMFTLRFSPQTGQELRLREWIVQHLLPGLVEAAGVTGAHLIENAVPAVPLDQQTAEQKLRGGDASADWVLLVSGYDPQAVANLAKKELSEDMLMQQGAAAGLVSGTYRLGYAMGVDDLASSIHET
jgi:hypothetical protein